MLLKKQHTKYYLAASVSLIVFLVYLSSLQNEFIDLDDYEYIVENTNIRSLNFAFLKWAFLDFYASNWHPLTWISHALDYAVWGLNPQGHHLVNNILHSINTFIVVVLTIKLVETWRRASIKENLSTFWDERAIFVAGGVTGLLFGLHPMHVESVAWVAERKDLLCAFFFLLSIVMYTEYVSCKYIEKGRGVKDQDLTKKYLLSLGFFTLALFSKPMAVSLPAVLLILDWFPFRRIQSGKSFFSVLVEKAPFILLSLFTALLTILAQKEGIKPIAISPLPSRLLVACLSLIAYLWKMILPLNLNPFYPYPTDISFLSLEYFPAVAFLVGITVILIVIARKKRLWLSLWAYHVVTLIPVIGIIQVGNQSMADRYAYLPGLGLFFAMGLLAAWGSGEMNVLQKQQVLVAKFFSYSFAVLVIFSLVFLTIKQIRLWKNGINLWSYSIEKKPNTSYVAHRNRGNEFLTKGQIEKALADFDQAIALNPSYYDAYLNRGIAYGKSGQFDKAIADFDKAIILNPYSFRAYNNKGMVYGKIGSFEKAIEQFSKAIDIKPNYSLAYGYRGIAYFLSGDDERGLENLNKAIELDANNTVAYATRGNLYMKKNNTSHAISDFRKACDLGDIKGCDALQSLRPSIPKTEQ